MLLENQLILSCISCWVKHNSSNFVDTQLSQSKIICNNDLDKSQNKIEFNLFRKQNKLNLVVTYLEVNLLRPH